MKFSFGDIYLANCAPNFGREYGKVRPVIVVQEENISQMSPLVTIMPISSKVEKMEGTDVFVGKDDKNRLSVDSVVKVHQISSYDKERFLHFIGKVNSPVIRKVRGYLRRHFGL